MLAILATPPLDLDPLRLTQVFLLQALLRGTRYPKSRELYDALSAAGRPWDTSIAAPLARVAQDPLFRVDPEWTVSGFQEKLAGRRVPRPAPVSVEAMLCAHGNTRSTWHAILDCGQITPAQVERSEAWVSCRAGGLGSRQRRGGR